MTKDELLRKDFQLLTETTLMNNAAYLRLILENQAVIISELKKIPIESIMKQMNAYLGESKALIDKLVKENIPDYTH